MKIEFDPEIMEARARAAERLRGLAEQFVDTAEDMKVLILIDGPEKLARRARAVTSLREIADQIERGAI